jgi:hypothetical protein
MPRVSGGLCRDWDRDRTFGVNCDIFADIVGNPERGVTGISGDQAGVAFSPSRRRELKLQKEKTIDSFFCPEGVKN